MKDQRDRCNRLLEKVKAHSIESNDERYLLANWGASKRFVKEVRRCLSFLYAHEKVPYNFKSIYLMKGNKKDPVGVCWDDVMPGAIELIEYQFRNVKYKLLQIIFVFLHEVYHLLYDDNEKKADDFAYAHLNELAMKFENNNGLE